MLGLHPCSVFSLVVEEGSDSLVLVHGLLIVVASLVVEHGLQGALASVVVAHRLSCPMTSGIFPDQGSNPCPLHWQADSYLNPYKCETCCKDRDKQRTRC